MDSDALLESLDQIRPNVRDAIETITRNDSLHTITDPPLREIQSVRFGMLSPQEILGLSVCEVTQSKISPPLEQTPYDERMGSISQQQACATCGETVKHCPGHYGHIKLASPIIHPQFIDNVKSILHCVCLKCSRLLMRQSEIDLELAQSTRVLKFRDRLKSIEELSKNIPFCQACSSPHPTLVVCELSIYQVHDKHRYLLSPEECFRILERISDEDLRSLGYMIHTRHTMRHGTIPDPLQSFRPEWMITSYLLVLPPISRPPAFDGDLKNDDDLTSSYIEIIKRNQKLSNPGLKEKQRQELLDELAMHIKAFIDNSDKKMTHTSGKPINSIKERVSGKRGHMRGKLMGKRVDSSARTVITGDPNLRLNEVGVPYELARDLTFPETVTERNYAKMIELWTQNKVNVVRRIGKRGLREYKQEIRPTRLQLGDVVYRHLQDGDRVVFNRQPTLHRGSMMSHIVRLLHGKTFRMNLSATKPYNADFDGDEMQLHVPQDYATVAELGGLMDVSEMIVSSQSNKPIIGVIQDALVGTYLMTRPRIYKGESNRIYPVSHVEYSSAMMSRETFFDCVLSASTACNGSDSTHELGETYIKRALELTSNTTVTGVSHETPFNGKMLFSVLLPRDFNYTHRNNAHPVEHTVNIVDGVLKTGVITNANIGSSYRGIIHRLFKDYSPRRAAEFINAIQLAVNRWLLTHGHSVGIRDFVTSAKQEIAEKIHKAYIEVESIVQNGDAPEIKEFKINNALNSHGQQQAVSGLCENNRLKAMVDSGSKGNNMNILQITSHLGQNNVEGKRIRPEIDDGSRTLVSFRRGDTHPRTRGFIEHSFMDGLTPEEFWFHAKAGREGVINTAVKTRDSGYAQRKLVKRMEDLIVREDRTVRNSVGNIVQFSYGPDALDPKNAYTSGVGFVDVAGLVEKLNANVD